MNYCNIEDIESVIPRQELINLTVDNPTYESVVDSNIFNKCAEFADSLIDSHIRAKYKLPLKVIPEFLTEIAKDIVAYRLYIRRPQKLPDHIKENYKSALELLVKIKKGDILLETPEELPEAEIDKPRPTYLVHSSKRIFTDNVMKRYGF